MKIPKGAQKAARMALSLKAKGYRGMTDTGMRRARQLARGGELSEYDVKIMKAWYARHYFTSRPGYMKFKRANFDETKFNKSQLRGAISYLGWGGETMERIFVK